MDEDDLVEAINHNEIQQCLDSLLVDIEDGLDHKLELAARVSVPPVQVPSAGGCAP